MPAPVSLFAASSPVAGVIDACFDADGAGAGPWPPSLPPVTPRLAITAGEVNVIQAESFGREAGND